METGMFLTYLLVMAGITYLVRAVPFVLIRKRINNPYISAFLEYIPYAVLTAMTIPSIFYSTNSIVTAAAGFAAALVMAYFEKSLIIVALSASCGVLVTQLIMNAV